MHHWRWAKAFLKVERVAAVSERAFSDDPGERAVLAEAGVRPKRASTAWRWAASPRPKRRTIGASSPPATSICQSSSRKTAQSRSSSEGVGARKLLAIAANCSVARAPVDAVALGFK